LDRVEDFSFDALNFYPGAGRLVAVDVQVYQVMKVPVARVIKVPLALSKEHIELGGQQ